MKLGPLFSSIEKGAIERLVVDGVSEDQHLEYKEHLPGTASAEKKEFLADVAAFANSGGGDSVFGIVERRDAGNKQTGVPEVAKGVGSINTDAEQLRLDSMIRDGIVPRVPVRIVSVDSFPDGPVVVVRIPRTTYGPHLVVFERHNRFYGRSNGGRFLLGIDDIRAAFSTSAEAAERATRFRDSRIAAVVAGEIPVKAEAGLFILWVIPQVVAVRQAIDPAAVPRDKVPIPMPGSGNFGYVAEGIVLRAEQGYTLVMRSGAIEGTYHFYGGQDQHLRVIPSSRVECEAVRFVRKAVDLFQHIDLDGPYQVFAALVGIRNHPLARPTKFGGGYSPSSFDRDLLILPDVVLEDGDPSQVVARLRPMFDGLWQAAGQGSDPYYTEGGESTKW